MTFSIDSLPLIPGGPASPFMTTKRRTLGRIIGPRSPLSPYVRKKITTRTNSIHSDKHKRE
jgi:hypothetical protein